MRPILAEDSLVAEVAIVVLEPLDAYPWLRERPVAASGRRALPSRRRGPAGGAGGRRRIEPEGRPGLDHGSRDPRPRDVPRVGRAVRPGVRDGRRAARGRIRRGQVPRGRARPRGEGRNLLPAVRLPAVRFRIKISRWATASLRPSSASRRCLWRRRWRQKASGRRDPCATIRRRAVYGCL